MQQTALRTYNIDLANLYTRRKLHKNKTGKKELRKIDQIIVFNKFKIKYILNYNMRYIIWNILYGKFGVEVLDIFFLDI